MRYLFLAPAILWTIVILYVTLIPGKEVPDVQISDKLIHFGVFAALFVLAAFGLQKERISHPVVKAVIYSLLVGIVTECLQYFIPGRSFSMFDMLANVAGVICLVPVTRVMR